MLKVFSRTPCMYVAGKPALPARLGRGQVVSISTRRHTVACHALFGRTKAASGSPDSAATSIAEVEREVAAAAGGDAPQQSQCAPEASALAGQPRDALKRGIAAAAKERLIADPSASTTTAAPSSPTSSLPLFLGVLFAAGAALLLAYRQTISTAAASAISAGTGAIGSGLQQKRLQREAVARLNELSSALQNSASADLSAKNLGDEGAAYAVEALAFNTTCVAANLSNNGIGRGGIAQLCEVLPTCRLETLVLATNSVGDEGAELLAAKLSGNSHLSALDLSSNGIGDTGAAALAEGLKLNTTLTKLDLRWVAAGRRLQAGVAMVWRCGVAMVWRCVAGEVTSQQVQMRSYR